MPNELRKIILKANNLRIKIAKSFQAMLELVSNIFGTAEDTGFLRDYRGRWEDVAVVIRVHLTNEHLGCA